MPQRNREALSMGQEEGRNSIERRSKLSREKLGDTVVQSIADKRALEANDPETTYNNLVQGQERYLQRINDATNAFGERRDGLSGEIHAILASHDADGKAGEQVEDIFDALTQPAPAFGEKPMSRYIGMEQTHPSERRELPGTWVYYHIEPAAIDRDMKFLEDLANKLPRDEQRPIRELQGMLKHMLSFDELRAKAFAIGKRNSENYADKRIGEMLKITAFVGLIALAAVTAVVSIGNKKIPWASGLFIGVAALIGSKSLRQTLFGGKHERALEEVNQKINNPAFKSASVDCDIADKPWVATAQMFHDHPELCEVRPATASPEEREAFAEKVASTQRSAKQHADFMKLMNNKEQYESFVAMTQTKDPDAWGLCRDFIGFNCNQYIRDPKEIKKAATEAKNISARANNVA
jgi:hypothetical protein